MSTLLRSLRRTTIRTIVGGVVVVGTLEVTTQLPSQGRSSATYHALADRVGTPLLRYISNPEQAHHLAIQLLKDMPQFAPKHRPSSVEQQLNVSTTIGSLKIPNPIGLAAGFDKDGEVIQPLMDLGFGLVEIGSVTLEPQPGNPSPRMFRLLQDDAIINRYGFNSQGMDYVKTQLQSFRSQSDSTTGRSVLGVNLGKNKTSTTPLEDYQTLIRELGPYADYLVINVSSPNTPGLRDLQSTESLEYLLKGCHEARQQLSTSTNQPPPPLLVKLSPDLADDELQEIATILLQLKQSGMVDGIIVSNTTTSRPQGLQSPHRQETGGLSGRPLRARSTECIRLLYAATQGQLPIIGVGGIFNVHDVYEKLLAGASVVQIYTSLVYQGPGLVSQLRHDLAQLIKDNGFRSIDQVIGLDHEELYWQRRFQSASPALINQHHQQQRTGKEEENFDHDKGSRSHKGSA
jgi:dihydroorotate dehydrogenase